MPDRPRADRQVVLTLLLGVGIAGVTALIVFGLPILIVSSAWQGIDADIPPKQARVELAGHLKQRYGVTLDPDAVVLRSHQTLTVLQGEGHK